MSDQEALDVYTQLLAITGLTGAHPTMGEIKTVQRALTRGWTPDQLATVTTLSMTAAPSDQRGYLLRIIEKRSNEQPRESSSTTATEHRRPPADRTSPAVPGPDPGFTTPDVTHAGIKAAKNAVKHRTPAWADLTYCETMLTEARSGVEREYWQRAHDRAQARARAASDDGEL